MTSNFFQCLIMRRKTGENKQPTYCKILQQSNNNLDFTASTLSINCSRFIYLHYRNIYGCILIYLKNWADSSRKTVSALYSQYEQKHARCYLLQADRNISIFYYQTLLCIINVLCCSGKFSWNSRSLSLYVSFSCNLSPNSLFYILLSSSPSVPTSQFPRSFSPSSFAHVTFIPSFYPLPPSAGQLDFAT